MSILPSRAAAWIGATGGLVLAVYAVMKTLFGAPGGWPLPFVPAASSWMVYHLLEVVPLLFVAVGVYGLYRHRSPEASRVARGGLLLTLAACGGAIVAHGLEHLAPKIPIPVRFFGTQNVWMWAYYGSWFTIALGLTIVGAASAPTGVLDGTVRMLVVWTLPIAFGLAILIKLAMGSGFELGFALAVSLSAFLGSWWLAWDDRSGGGAERSRVADDQLG